ncbi:MAG: hypothetical protein MJ174_04085 [Treponema sp.]|nr:hypothetical protein [Treponema sp.]
MAINKKIIKDNKFGLSNTKKKIGVNYWRFFFNGIQKNGGVESLFFIEFEMLNPWDNPEEATLGFKPRVQIKEEDLQYALSGTESARGLKVEEIVHPSYIVVRVGKLDENPKQLCQYFSLNDINFIQKPFEIHAGNNLFTENEINGFVSVSLSDKTQHPEYFCDNGSANWNLQYDYVKSYGEGFDTGSERWFPSGMNAVFSGVINFDGEDYLVNQEKSFGYIDRYWGKSFLNEWFHISSCNFTSLISGKTLLDSSFAIHGIYEDKISLIGNFEGADIIFAPNGNLKNYDCVWNCCESPEADEDDDKNIHWSVSVNSKLWVIDIDVFCKVKYLYNRCLECSEGKRKVINILQTGEAFGEIKIYKKIKNDLEQIEYAKINKALCEFGHVEETQI